MEECDVFVKVERDYSDEQTLHGALVTFLTLSACLWLVWSDVSYYFNPSYKFRFAADNPDDPSGIDINH